MTQENKKLLIKDLCARLPYGVKVHINFPREKVYTLSSIQKDTFTEEFKCKFEEYPQSTCIDERVQPYLFPMSSITEEQIEEFNDLTRDVFVHKSGECNNINEYDNTMYSDIDDWLISINWLNSHHFDYRGLIDKELAIDATNLNIY